MKIYEILKQKVDNIKLDIIDNIFILIKNNSEIGISLTNKCIYIYVDGVNDHVITNIYIENEKINIFNTNDEYDLSIHNLSITILLNILNEIENYNYRKINF